jgi:hypothetical protein
MATYGVCLVLVLSFIFFEVLDVDGSDFAPVRAATTLKVAEPPQDIRRVPMQSAAPIDVIALDPHAERLQIQLRTEDARADTPSHTALRRACRSMLARALLADPAPVA